MKLKNKKVLVYGYGLSGKESAKFLLKMGAKVFVYDDNQNLNVSGLTTFNPKFDIGQLDLVVISPGIYNTYLLKLLEMSKVKIISEMELAFCFVKKGKIIAITGTNGKTTTTSILGEVLTLAKKDVYICGNIGVPFISFVSFDSASAIFLVEVSSFQLERIFKFKPHIAAILNIAPDHLNRHKTMQNYINIKFSITKNQGKNNFCLLNSNLLEHSSHIKKNKSKILTFSNSSDCYFDESYLYYKNFPYIKLSEIQLQGEKNYENLLACLIIAKQLSVEDVYIKEVFKTFKGGAHRIEVVAKKKGVVYVDDSKATNPSSTKCALEVFENNVILLLGGSDKGYEFDDIFEYHKKIKHIFCYGQTKEKILCSAKKNNFENITVCSNLREAFFEAKKVAQKGDTILLSPACASFDEFKNYQHRGEVFKGLINEAKNQIKKSWNKTRQFIFDCFVLCYFFSYFWLHNGLQRHLLFGFT